MISPVQCEEVPEVYCGEKDL